MSLRRKFKKCRQSLRMVAKIARVRAKFSRLGVSRRKRKNRVEEADNATDPRLMKVACSKVCAQILCVFM